MGILYYLSLAYNLLNFDREDLLCKSVSKNGDDELMIIHLKSLTSTHYSLNKVPNLDFRKILQAYYYSRSMIILNSPASTPEVLLDNHLNPIQLFEFENDALQEIQMPDIPKLEDEDWRITSACIDDQWICIAVASDNAAKIYVINRRTRQFVATLLESGIPCNDTGTKYYAAIDIKTSGNSLAAVSESGHIAIWDELTEDQAEPTISWEAGHEAVRCHFSKEYGRVLVSGAYSLRGSLFKTHNGEKVHDWNHRDLDQEALHHWVNQDCRFSATAIMKPDSDDPIVSIKKLGEYGEHGDRERLVKLQPIEGSGGYWNSFYTAIIDWNCVTFVGPMGLLQLSFGADHSVRGDCSAVVDGVDGFPFPPMPFPTPEQAAVSGTSDDYSYSKDKGNTPTSDFSYSQDESTPSSEPSFQTALSSRPM